MAPGPMQRAARRRRSRSATSRDSTAAARLVVATVEERWAAAGWGWSHCRVHRRPCRLCRWRAAHNIVWRTHEGDSHSSCERALFTEVVATADCAYHSPQHRSRFLYNGLALTHNLHRSRCPFYNGQTSPAQFQSYTNNPTRTQGFHNENSLPVQRTHAMTYVTSNEILKRPCLFLVVVHPPYRSPYDLNAHAAGSRSSSSP